MDNRSPINVFSKRGGLAVQLFTSELKDGPSRLSKDELANFGLKLNGRRERIRKTHCLIEVI